MLEGAFEGEKSIERVMRNRRRVIGTILSALRVTAWPGFGRLLQAILSRPIRFGCPFQSSSGALSAHLPSMFVVAFAASVRLVKCRTAASLCFMRHVEPNRGTQMSDRFQRFISSAALALLLAVTGSDLARAAPDPLPANSSAYKGYAQLTARWLEWIIAIPVSSTPLIDDTGANAAVGQSGKVWFLAGTYFSGTATRNVTVPVGTALFFPIVNYFWLNTPEYGDPAWSPSQETFVRGLLASNVDTAYGLLLEIDGQAVPDVDKLRVSGAVGQCTVPPSKNDNIFGIDLLPGLHECVGDGYWALLPPLSAGHHTIRFTGGLSSAGFSLDVTYNVTVVPR